MISESEYVDAIATLSKEFLANNISCDAYRTRFFECHLKEPAGISKNVFNVVNRLFIAVEMCEPDPELLAGLRAESPELGYIDEEQLRKEAYNFVSAAAKLMGLP